MRKTILYIASSLDGYISKPNDDLSFLSLVEEKGEDYGYGDFIKTVDTVILGSRTYNWINRQLPNFPHEDKETYVITRSQKPSVGKLHFYSGDISSLIDSLKRKTGGNIFIDGGGQIVNLLLELQLIDEIFISFIPILLGQGTKLFYLHYPEQILEFVSAKSFKSGLVQHHYKFKKG